MPAASRAEEEIKNAFSKANIQLQPSTGGVFIVSVDDKVIFSKKDLIGTDIARFPDDGELTSLLNQAGY